MRRRRIRYSECDPRGAVFNTNRITHFGSAPPKSLRQTVRRHDAHGRGETNTVDEVPGVSAR
jgi:acyl-CoA thioesterase FadM